MTTERIQIRITADGMAALARVSSGKPETAHTLTQALTAAGVRFGIDATLSSQLSEALADPAFQTNDAPIARGQPARSSRDAGFEPAFQTAPQPGRLREDGTMDFYHRELLKPARAGAVLGHMRTARDGVPGMRVDGQPLPFTHEAATTPRIGDGAALQPDGTVVATRDGTISFRPDLLEVEAVHVHEGNVDLRSGHLSTDGGLIIRGDVKRTFGVRARGDLEISGEVQSGSVYAGGTIRVDGHVGGGDGIVSACGDMQLGLAERTTLISGGTMIVNDVVHCELRAQRIVIQRGMRGGNARAELSISVDQAGSPNAKADTVLAAGLPLDPPKLVDEPIIIQTIHEFASLPYRESERPLSHASMVMLATKSPPRSSPPPPGSTGVSQRPAVNRDAAAPGEPDPAAQARAEQLLRAAFVQVLGTAHAGVTIQLGEVRKVLDKPLHHVRFTLDMATRAIVVSAAQS